MTISSIPRGIPVWVAYWKVAWYSEETFIWGASPSVSYELSDKNAIGWRRWNITTQEWKVCDVETEIISFVVNGSVKSTIPPKSPVVNLGKKQKCCSLWCPCSAGYMKHLVRKISGFCVVYGQHYRCTCKWDWTDVLTVSFPLIVKTVWIPLWMNTERCRRK